MRICMRECKKYPYFCDEDEDVIDDRRDTGGMLMGVWSVMVVMDMGADRPCRYCFRDSRRCFHVREFMSFTLKINTKIFYEQIDFAL
jgi:hypothetical protein